MNAKKLNQLRIKIYKHFKKRASELEGNKSKELITYARDLEKASRRLFRPSSFEKLEYAAVKSNIIFTSDFHTFDQNAKTIIRLIKLLLEQDIRPIIALEMIFEHHEKIVDAYFHNHITELEFLESINYHYTWRFPWAHYKQIFDLAREHNLKIHGLNTKGSLFERDHFAAAKLLDICSDNPKQKTIVLYGELHLTLDKIPGMIKASSPKMKLLIIHQNLDTVYWKMQKNNAYHDIIAFNKQEFCINSSPPWSKYESMVYWFENADEDIDFDLHEYHIETGKKLLHENADEEFLVLANEMARLLSFDDVKSTFQSFKIYDHSGLEAIEENLANITNKTLRNFYFKLVESGQSFKIPDSHIYYCSNYSLNRLSYLAGIYVFNELINKYNHENDKKYLYHHQKIHRFYFWTHQHFFAHFFAKMINPHIKCDLYINLLNHKRYVSITQANIYETAIKLIDGKRALKLNNLNNNELYKLSQITGHYFAEYFFQNWANQLELVLDGLFEIPKNHNDFIKFRSHCLQHHPEYQHDMKRAF